AIFWGGVLAVIFNPLHRRLLSLLGGRSPNLAAFLTLLCITLIVILPMLFIAASLANEVAGLYTRINSGQLYLGGYYERIVGARPPSVRGWLASFGLGDLFSVRGKLSAGALQPSQFLVKQAVNSGQNTFQYLVGLGIMLYLLFCLLRDGAIFVPRLRRLIP